MRERKTGGVGGRAEQPPRRRTGLAGRLNQEWEHVRAESGTLAALPAWAEQEPALADLADVASLEAAMSTRANDEVLRALLRLCRSGDALAGRAALQGLLGVAVCLARRTSHHAGGDREEAEARAVSGLLDLLHTVPLTTSCRIADRIALDLLSRLTHDGRRRGVEVAVGDSSDLELVRSAGGGSAHGSPCGGQPQAERADLAVLAVLAEGARSGAIRPDEARLLWDVHSPAGPGGLGALAAAHGVEPAAVRQRASRARRRLVASMAA